MPKSIAVILAAGIWLSALPAQAWQITWLGHAGFLVEAKDGTRVLIDTWLDNPKFPNGYKMPDKVDGILVSHGHFDHSGSAQGLSTRYKAPLIGVGELVDQLAPKGGPKGMGGNVSGTLTVKGIKIVLITAVHSSSIAAPEGPSTYGGNPVGFVLLAAGERPLVHGGDTGLTRDYEAVKDAFHPGIALLPIGGRFTLDPAQAAIAAGYLGVKDVVPMHYGTFGLLTGTPAQLRKAGTRLNVHELTPGKVTTIK